MKSRLQKSIDYIKGFCEKHYRCDDCRLQDKETNDCFFGNRIPTEWEYKAESEEK